MTTTAPPAAPRSTTTAFALAALAYALAGIAALPLAVPPGYATPLYPAAGIALAAVVMFGPRLLGAVALGALAVGLWIGLQHRAEAAAPVLAGALALGATLQALAGAALVRRLVPQPMALSEPREIVRFLAAAVVSCAVSPIVTGVALLLAHAVPAGELPFLLGTSYVGNLLGVLIATPVALSLCGEPRQEWAPRRLSVGLTLGLALLLLALGIRQVVQWNRERVESAFNHDATGAAQALVAQLREPLNALEALHGVFIASDNVSPEEMRLATQAWLQPGGAVQALGWSQRIARRELPAFEAAVRAEGDPSFKVFDRSDAPVPTELADEVLAIHYIEPRAGNAPARGVNVWSIPVARTAVQLARRTGRPAATGPFRLTQQTAGPNEVGVVIYQALYARGASNDAAERSTAFNGVLFATLRMNAQLQALAAQLPRPLSLCLVDVTAGALLHLAGAPGCEARSADLQLERAFDYAGRRWEIRVGAAAADLPSAHSADVWLFALVGLLSTALLGGFILIVTGRTRRIETAVRERTAALRAEVREREVAEGALRESEQRFRNILNNVPIGVIYTDLRGNVKQTNPRFCELTGYSDAELLRMSLADYTHPEDMVQDVDLMAQLVRGEIPMYRRHKRYIARNGATVWVQATVSLLRDANAKPRSIVGVVEDITEHLKLEEAERAREAAEASNRAKSEFLSRMSHELRTPLNAMLGFAQLLELDPRHPLSDAQRPWVGQIQQAGWHLLEMINDVLDLSRIESGNLRLQIETLDLTELLDATLAMVDADAQQRDIVISQEFDPGTTTLLGDATRVKQILTNLLSNAVKYNSDAGRIHVSSRLAGTEAVEIVVTDTGLGMTAAQLAELFQPFNRLGRERSAQQGTGIGLVISQRLAELMGGSLRARSVAGQGSAFILTLPCALDPDTVRSDFDAYVSEPAEYHRRVVHYVEDNETNVEVMRGILAQRPQVEMRVSVTGLDGLAAIRAHRPDLILLDMHLPDISGMELLRHLKQDAHTVHVPIVVVSADALAQQIDAAFEAGCTHYLTKPVNVAELLGVLDDLLERMDTAFS
ncbi:MAG TPA: CHASE domain-containing protein [Burkholderiaceae bacterium]|nr:CHASE domain-containing protein [Burkholderiaceae bacterium]